MFLDKIIFNRLDMGDLLLVFTSSDGREARRKFYTRNYYFDPLFADSSRNCHIHIGLCHCSVELPSEVRSYMN